MEDLLLRSIFGLPVRPNYDTYLIIIEKIESFLKGEQFSANYFTELFESLSNEEVEAFLDLGIEKGFLTNIKFVGIIDGVKTYEKIDLPYLEVYRHLNKAEREYKTISNFLSFPKEMSSDEAIEQLEAVLKSLIAANTVDRHFPVVDCSYNDDGEPTYRIGRAFRRPPLSMLDEYLYSLILKVSELPVESDFTLSELMPNVKFHHSDIYTFNELIANNVFRKHTETDEEILCSNVICKDFNDKGEMVYSVVEES